MRQYTTYTGKKTECEGCSDTIKYGDPIYISDDGIYHLKCDWIALEREVIDLDWEALGNQQAFREE